MAAQKISFAAEVWFLISFSTYCPLGSVQTYPNITFRGTTLANHSYVNLSLVGNDSSGSDSVQCRTDLSTCCSGSQGVHKGDWYFPNGTRLPLDGNVYETRGDKRVNLHRTIEGNVFGIYRCGIATSSVHHNNIISIRDTVYVGLYINGGNDGSIALKCFIIIIVYR